MEQAFVSGACATGKKMVCSQHCKHCQLLHSTPLKHDGCQPNAFPALAAPQQSNDGNDSDGQEEPEEAYVDRRAAKMNLHAGLYNTYHQDQRISEREQQILENLRFQYVQCWWECLYDANEHARLREVIVNKL